MKALGIRFRLMLVFVVVLGMASTTGAQGNLLSACDATTQALVLAAQDAYGYDWQAAWQSGFADMTGDDSMAPDAMEAPEATESAKLLAMKQPPVWAQDATPEAGAMATEEAAGEPASMGNVPCGQLRNHVVAFILAQNQVTVTGGAGGMTFTIGGQEFEADFHVQMSGPEEVPGPGDDDAIGEGWVALVEDRNQVCWWFTLAGLELPAQAAHIHVGALGEAGPPVVPMTAPETGSWAGCADADAATLSDIRTNPAGFYVNVHTASFPQGALRGQLQGM